MTFGERTFTVNMTDVDLVQVNYARFFVWMDDGYDALLRTLGHPLSGILREGLATPVVETRCEYRRPVSLDDEFTVRSAIVAHGRTSYTVAHRFEDAAGVFAIGRSTHVWVDTSGGQHSAPLPGFITDALEPDFLAGLELRP